MTQQLKTRFYSPDTTKKTISSIVKSRWLCRRKLYWYPGNKSK